jgi:hypothetical protein
MSVIVEPGRTFLDNSGRVLNAGTVTFYVAGGTSTKKAIYPTAADQAALTNQLANPQTLNSAGRLQQQVHGSNSYRMVVKDAIGATILDEDIIVTTDYTALTSATVGGLLYPRTAREISAVITPTDYAYPEGNVRRYGAKGDGSTDDTTAIQNAFNVQCGTVTFPAANAGLYYKTTATITATVPTMVTGSGPQSCTVILTGASAGSSVIHFNNSVTTAYFYGIEKITLRSSNGSPYGLKLTNVSYLRCDDVQCYNVLDAVFITGTVCFSNEFRQLVGYTIGRNTVRWDTFTGGGHFDFADCTFAGTNGMFLDTASTVSEIGLATCNFEACTNNGLRFEGDAFGLSITGCRTENNGASDYVIYPTAGKNARGISITGGFHSQNSAATTPIILGGNGGTVRGFNIAGNYVAVGASSYYVQLNGDGESGLIAGNYINNGTGQPVNALRAGVTVFGNENTGGKLGAQFAGTASTVTYSASMTLDLLNGSAFVITATNGTAFTINAPSNALAGQIIDITIRNTSGGALGAATWNAVFKMVAWASPATGFSRSIRFRYDGTNWVELARGAADVPN